MIYLRAKWSGEWGGLSLMDRSHIRCNVFHGNPGQRLNKGSSRGRLVKSFILSIPAAPAFFLTCCHAIRSRPGLQTPFNITPIRRQPSGYQTTSPRVLRPKDRTLSTPAASTYPKGPQAKQGLSALSGHTCRGKPREHGQSFTCQALAPNLKTPFG